MRYIIKVVLPTEEYNSCLISPKNWYILWRKIKLARTVGIINILYGRGVAISIDGHTHALDHKKSIYHFKKENN